MSLDEPEESSNDWSDEEPAQLVLGPLPDSDDESDTGSNNGSDDELDADDPGVAAPETVTSKQSLAELAELEARLEHRNHQAAESGEASAKLSTLLHILGEPHHGYPVFHVHESGQRAISRMIEALLTQLGLRVGRYTEDYFQIVTERIVVDGRPISAEKYLEQYRELAPYLSMVDSSSSTMSKGGVLASVALTAFADAPVEAAILETSAEGAREVAGITPRISVLAAMTPRDIAVLSETAPTTLTADSVMVIGEQQPDAMNALLRLAVDADATVARAGSEFSVLSRTVAVDGQLLSLQGLGGVYSDIFLPLHGAHQATNAAVALAAVEAFFGAGKERQLITDSVREAFASIQLPAQVESVRAVPNILVDSAHDNRTAEALAATISDEFSFRKLVAIVAATNEHEAQAVLHALEPLVSDVVVTASSAVDALPVAQLRELAIDVFNDERVFVESALDSAVETAVTIVEQRDSERQPLAGGGVLITGSAAIAGDARNLFGKDPA